VTSQVETKYKYLKEDFKRRIKSKDAPPVEDCADKYLAMDYFDTKWHDSFFMGHEKGQGAFLPESIKDRKLWLANEIAF
jgi:hypothetical protein